LLEQVLRPGSPKEMALRKWGFWVEAFSSICTPDNMALQMSPMELIEALEERPREMAILRMIQAEMRRERKADLDRMRAEQAANRRRN
jgi:hypothetical protein